MSIALQTKVKDLESQLALAIAKSNALQAEISELKSRMDALEARPKPGRPPKEQDGRQSTPERN